MGLGRGAVDVQSRLQEGFRKWPLCATRQPCEKRLEMFQQAWFSWLFSHLEGVGLDAGDAVGGEGGVGVGDAAGEIDGAGGVIDDDGLEAEGVAV